MRKRSLWRVASTARPVYDAAGCCGPLEHQTTTVAGLVTDADASVSG